MKNRKSSDINNQLFSPDTDWKNNACLNWCHDPMHLYISGYKDAADILANRVIESGNNQDSLVYPIAFLYRQYIELQLKNIIKESRYLFEDTSGFPEHHKIKALWDVANGLMKKIIFELDKSAGEYITKKDLKAITSIINDFVIIDPESFAFRYPKDKQGNKNLEGLSHINIRNLAEKINLLSEQLDKFVLVIDMLREWQDEMKAEYSP